jgi:hypothetical protein
MGSSTLTLRQAPVSQRVINCTISDLSFDHLPTKFATVSQNLSKSFFTISDFRLVVGKSSLCGGTEIDQFTWTAYLSDKLIYPALVLFEESNCIDWINFYYIRSLSCNNVAPVTNLCLGRATTRSHSSQWSKKKVAVET